MHGTERGPDGDHCPHPPHDGHGVPPGRTAEAVAWRNRFLLLLDRVQSPLAVCRIDGTMIIANPAMAAQWDVSPGRLLGRNALELFRPREPGQLERLVEALRLGHRSRYPIEVRWRTGGTERCGELTVDPVSETPAEQPALLAQLRVRDAGTTGRTAGREARDADSGGPDAASPAEARILALAASGATTASIAGTVGLTADGVTYHLTRLSKRWNVPNRAALVARAYALGVLDAAVWPPAPSRG